MMNSPFPSRIVLPVSNILLFQLIVLHMILLRISIYHSFLNKTMTLFLMIIMVIMMVPFTGPRMMSRTQTMVRVLIGIIIMAIGLLWNCGPSTFFPSRGI
jgi:hypothetical protein